jgi:ferredoxin
MEDTDNIIHADVFKKKASVLIEFDDPEDDKKLRKYLASADTTIDEAPHYAASYLWNERLFGMKTKRLGPTILACEVTMPNNKTADFIEKAKKTGHNFGVEVGIDSYILDEKDALVMATFLCDSRKLKYFINLAMISILTKTAVSMGAKPYGLGIWNAPFINNLFDSEELAKLTGYKKKVDPNNIMNRGKFFRVGSKWLNIPSIIFKPSIFSMVIGTMITLSPVLGKMITLLLGKNKKVDKLDITLSTHACAKCGNCIAVCPAYLITKNEKVTAKGKVALAKRLLSGKHITKQESDTAFLCMHCKACEEVCQTNLELIPIWEAIEERLEKKFGRPQEAITEFLKKVDESEEYWEMVERNS